jgi:NAD-dependent dihydropyrimidine dehydrogenase PreA subunit
MVIAEPCVGTKDTACVAACPVDCIHPKKNASHGHGRPSFDQVSQLPIDISPWMIYQRSEYYAENHDPRPQDSRPIDVDPLQPRV